MAVRIWNFSSRAASSISTPSSNKRIELSDMTAKVRSRLRVPSPHVDEHIPQGAQSSQPQKVFSWHLRWQLSVCSAAASSQGLPPQVACAFTCLRRFLWPPHLSQEPHGPQSVHSQSTCLQPVSHTCMLQPSVSWRASSQPGPPPLGSCKTTLALVCWPPPQVTLHVLHSSQWPRRQATADSLTHSFGTSSPLPGLHVASSFKEPMQNLPSPSPLRRMVLARFLMPSQDVVQSLQGFQSESRQSTALWQCTSSLQLPTSRDGPLAGVPH
mmetsp:Transcript_17674/g.38734  ORF Transcript_17674/g.38734 Transcript_17674/m.38734 type:complete len:269 (-) Transcript_17674:196-1002(-)